MEKLHLNVIEREKNGMRLFAARTGAKDVVAIQGSVLGGYAMLPHELSMVQRIATDIMDAGTRSRSKETIRDALASRGASINFSPGKDRTNFDATCLPEDIDFILTLIAECLASASLSASELNLQKKRTLAELNETKTQTRPQASQEFMRLIYDRKHINYVEQLSTSIAHTEAVTRSNLLLFQKLLGTGGLVLAIVGDIAPERVLAKAERIFALLPKGTEHATEKSVNTAKPNAKESLISIPDKANIDVFMGAQVPLNYDSPEYIPFTLLASMLGGRGLSTGHLMRTIRERDGLTYGIYASPAGFGGRADGALQIWATFSPARFEESVAATRKEIKVFLKAGITESVLVNKKVEIIGRYAVGLGTSNGLADALHIIGTEGKPLSYINEYPDLVAAVTLKDLEAASALVPWDSLSVAAAGTFTKGK